MLNHGYVNKQQLVAPLGFEPRQQDPESWVLPLDNRAGNYHMFLRIHWSNSEILGPASLTNSFVD